MIKNEIFKKILLSKYFTFLLGGGFVLLLFAKLPPNSSSKTNDSNSEYIDVVESTIESPDDSYDIFKMIMTETKRRECLGKRGSELKVYSDGGSPTIGYGCHISNLSKEWKKTIKRQHNKITEQQARELMYNHFELLDVVIKKELPNLSKSESWAVKSLTYNYGWGNVKKSKLFNLIKSGDKSEKIKREWLRTWANTDNHKISRNLEISLWLGDYETANEIFNNSYRELEKRGDFKYYKK